jgi:hypothetical protein
MELLNLPNNLIEDQWLEARRKTASVRPSVRELIRLTTMSLPGAPTKQSFATLSLGRGDSGIFVDLNKWRPGRDLQKFVDAGVDGFILRIGGPLQWAEGNWRYTEDPTFRPYMEAVNKIGMLNNTMGYVIHNPFEIWQQEYNTHVDLINQWTGGGYMPRALMLDHEVATCWRGATKITCVPSNLVNSLATTVDKMKKAFKRVVGVYTANWFVSANAPTEHTTYFDNINRPELGKTVKLWMAWYPQTFSVEYPDFQKAIETLLVPNGTQNAKYLNIGSHSSAELWQFTDRLKLPGDSTGVDVNVTMQSLDAFRAAFGLGQPAPEPEPDPKHDYAPEIQKLREVITVLGG